MENSLSPVVLFTYRRVPKETINSLRRNELAKSSEIFIYSDGYKSEVDKQDVLSVRKYLKTIDGFKSLTIVESEKNKGLAKSIIDGVTEVINKYKKIIVLEDDLIVSNDFLEYMNDALDFYKNDQKIWSISGYGPKLPCLENYNKDLYLSPRGSSWGWATWQDRWCNIDWGVSDFEQFQNDKQSIKRFNQGGNDLFKMLELQVLNKIDSWAIRWCYAQYKNNSYTVVPKDSKVFNDGFADGMGTHNSGADIKWSTELSNRKVKLSKLNADKTILECFRNFHNLKWSTRIGYWLRKNGGYIIIKKIYNKLK